MSDAGDEEVVRVLYNYSYTDDNDDITITAGDIYRLLEKTNAEWWQVYDPTDESNASFFVPAQYVEIVSEKSPFKALSDLDKHLSFVEPTGSPQPDYHDEDNVSGAQSGFTQYPPIENLHTPNNDYMNSYSADEPEGEYVNLNMYRNAAGIDKEGHSNREGLEAPGTADLGPKPGASAQELIHGTIPPPPPEEGTFVRVLVEGLPWDVYKEHSLQRWFYVNRETGERMWKPPRKDKPHTPEHTLAPSPTTPPAQAHPVSLNPPVMAKPVSPVTPISPIKESDLSGLDAEYDQIHDNGNLYFIHKSTQEKWKRLVDQVGRQYFHKLGSADTRWRLPSSDKVDSVPPVLATEQSIQHRDVSWENQGNRLSTFGGQSMRAMKAMSTYGQIESTGSLSKASTLPANFTVARPTPVPNVPSPIARPVNLTPSSSIGTLQPQPSQSQPQPQQQDETFAGYLNKAKIAEMGKKKSKKNWNQIYVVLQGSNLVFYKDQKSASFKPGSPHGRPEGVISLQGAHVDFNPPKEYTSKKNTILLTVTSGSLFLFQSDNEKNIREWFTRMKIVANDVSPVEVSPKESDKGITRSISADDSTSLHGVDKNRNLVGIRAKLLGLISRRPTQEDLIKRGIIKDAVFGAKLHELCDKEKSHVPNFVHKCIQAVESRGLSHDGLYRVSGNLAEIQRLRCAVDKDDSYNLHDSQWDINVLTGALKLFFRELKEPVFPFHLYDRFIEAVKIEIKKERLSAFKKAVSDLPRCNYFTLKELFEHLCKVIEKSHENRMQPQNVAIVFGPTLLWQKDDSISLAVQTVFQSKIVEFMLLECSELFK